MRRTTAALLTAGLALGPVVATASPALAAGPDYTNCTTLHRSWAHGIGRVGAHDKTTGTPVTTFRKDTAGYNKAVRANARLDADHDGIACEKK